MSDKTAEPLAEPVPESTLKEKQDTEIISFSGLHNANPDCKHELVAEWSGVTCSKCKGWFCY